VGGTGGFGCERGIPLCALFVLCRHRIKEYRHDVTQAREGGIVDDGQFAGKKLEAYSKGLQQALLLRRDARRDGLQKGLQHFQGDFIVFALGLDAQSAQHRRQEALVQLLQREYFLDRRQGQEDELGRFGGARQQEGLEDSIALQHCRRRLVTPFCTVERPQLQNPPFRRIFQIRVLFARLSGLTAQQAQVALDA
jgi:hypothetical protein